MWLFLHLLIKYYWILTILNPFQESRDVGKQDVAHETNWKQTYEDPMKIWELIMYLYHLGDMPCQKQEKLLWDCLLVCGRGSLQRWTPPWTLEYLYKKQEGTRAKVWEHLPPRVPLTKMIINVNRKVWAKEKK